jgi:ribosomal protein S18
MKPITPIEVLLNKLSKFKPVKINDFVIETSNPEATIDLSVKGANFVIYANEKTFEKATAQDVYVCIMKIKGWAEKRKAKKVKAVIKTEIARPEFKPLEVIEKPVKKSGAIKHTEFYDQHKHSQQGLERAKKRCNKVKLQSFYMPEERLTVFYREGKNETVIKNRILTRKQD